MGQMCLSCKLKIVLGSQVNKAMGFLDKVRYWVLEHDRPLKVRALAAMNQNIAMPMSVLLAVLRSRVTRMFMRRRNHQRCLFKTGAGVIRQRLDIGIAAVLLV